MQTRGDERTSQAGQSLTPGGPLALRLTNGAIAEINSIVRSNPSLMQFTGQAAANHVGGSGGDHSNTNGSLAAHAFARGRPKSMANFLVMQSGTSTPPVRFSGEDLNTLLHMCIDRPDCRSFLNTTRMTPLTGFVFDAIQYTCQACSYSTPSRLLFGEHIRCHTFQMPYSCGQCGLRTTLQNMPYHNRIKHGKTPPMLVHANPTSLVDGIMQKLGPAAPYSVSKVDVQPDRQNAAATTSPNSTFSNVPPDGSGDRSNASLADMLPDGDGHSLLQALINETNQQNLDMLAVNCDFKDGVYVCNLCKFSSRRPFEIFEHIIADVQRWKCCCAACVNSDPRSCAIVKAAVSKLIRREQEVSGETGDAPPTGPVTPIVIAPLGDDGLVDQDQYGVAVSQSQSQPAFTSDISWQSPLLYNYSTPAIHGRPPPSYSEVATQLTSTGSALPFVSESIGSPTLYVPSAPVASVASSAYEQAPVTTRHWPTILMNRHSTSTAGPVSNKTSVRLRVVPIDSQSTSRVNTVTSQCSSDVVSSLFQPPTVVRTTAAPTRPTQSTPSVPNPSAAPVNAMPLPEWLHPTLHELTMDLSREADKEKRAEAAVATEAADSSCVSGRNETGGAEFPAEQVTRNSGRRSRYPDVIELSDSSEEENTTEPQSPVSESVSGECTGGSVTETSQNKNRSGDDRSGRKKASTKHTANAGLVRAKRRSTAERDDKESRDSTPTEAGSLEDEVDNGHFFRCGIPECGDSFCDQDGLTSHIKRCHGSLKLFPCPYCSCLWSDYNLLVKHITVHSGPNPYRCVQCDVCFETGTGLRNHFNELHHVKAYFKCLIDGCRYESKLWTEFKIHVSCCHPAEDAYTCFACGGGFTNRKAYLRHVESGMETFICCAYCSMKSKLRYSIIRHLGSVHQGLAKKVAVLTEVKCDKARKSPPRTHTAEKPSVKPHQPARITTGGYAPIQRRPARITIRAVPDTPVQRRPAPITTASEPVLRQPASITTASEPVLRRCSHCDYADVDKASVDAHAASHGSTRDPELAFTCTLCTFGSDNMHEYMQHLANHRGEATQKLRYFRCPYCLFTSNQMALVERHLDKRHSEEPFKFEVQQKIVITNRRVTAPTPAVPLVGSPEPPKRRCAVATQDGNNERTQVCRDRTTPSKRPKRVSTPPVGHRRLVILLERCDARTLSTPDTRASRTRPKRKFTTGEDSDDDKRVTSRPVKKTRNAKQIAAVNKTTEAAQSSTNASKQDHSIASLMDECGVGDEEPMFSGNEDAEEEDSYWRDMIIKSTSPDEKNATLTRATEQLETHQDDSNSECALDEASTLSDNEDAYWKDVIQQKSNSAVVVNQEEIVLSDGEGDEEDNEEDDTEEYEEEDEESYWRNIVKNTKHDTPLEETTDSSSYTTVRRRSGTARVVGRKSVANTDGCTPAAVSGTAVPLGQISLLSPPATPGSSGGLTIAQYRCTSCKFVCDNSEVFDEHVRTLHEDSIARTATDDDAVKIEPPDTVVSADDDKMKYHCYLCSVDCQDWEAFELHMADVHRYTVIKSDTTSPFQDIVAVPIKKQSPTEKQSPIKKQTARRRRTAYQCSACSFSTYFKFQLRKHEASHYNQQDRQPASSPQKRTSPKKRDIESGSTDVNSNDTHRLAEPMSTGESGKIKLRSRAKKATVVDDDDTDIGGDDSIADRVRRVRFVKRAHAGGPGLYRCKKCGYADGRIDRVESHVLRSHLHLMPYKCPYCHRDSSDYDALLQHVADSHPKKPTCVIYRVTGAPKCRKLVRRYIVDVGVGFGGSESGTATVKKELRGDGQISDSVSSEIAMSSDRDRCMCDSAFCHEQLGVADKDGKMVYYCDLCSFRASLKMSFVQHRKSHLKATGVRCGYCDYTASSRHFLVNHMSVAHRNYKIMYQLVDSNGVVASAHPLDKGDTLTDGKETGTIEVTDVISDKEQEPTQDSCTPRDSCVDVTTPGDDAVGEGESTGLSVEPLLSDCDYTVTLNDTDSSIEEVMERLTSEQPVDSAGVKTNGATEETVDGSTTEKLGGLTEDKNDGSTVDGKDIAVEDKTNSLTQDQKDSSMEDTTDCSTYEKVTPSIEDKTNGSTKDNLGVTLEEPTGGSTEEKIVDIATDDMTDGSPEEKTSGVTEVNTDRSTDKKTHHSAAEEKVDCSTIQTVDITAEGKTGGSAEEKTDGSADENTKDSAEEKTDGSAEEKTNGSMEEKTDDSAEEKTKDSAEEKTDDSAEGKTDGSAEGKTDGSVEEKTDDSAEEKKDGSAKEKTDDSAEEKKDVSAEEKTDGSVEEKTDDSAEKKKDGSAKEKTEDSAEEKKDGSSVEKTDGSDEGKTDGSAEGKTDDSMEQKVDEMKKQKMDDLAEEKTDNQRAQATHGCTDKSTDHATAVATETDVDAQHTFKCVTCNATMLLEQDIQHHVMVEHLEQKPYACMYCDHSSADKRAVQLHTETAHAGRPSSIIYETNGQMEASVRASVVSVSSDGASHVPAPAPRVCHLCNEYTTSSMFQFLDHIAKEIKYTPYQCPYCSYSSIWRNAVKTHVVADHPNAQIRILLSEDVAQNRQILELVKQSDSPCAGASDDKSDFSLFGDKKD